MQPVRKPSIAFWQSFFRDDEKKQRHVSWLNGKYQKGVVCLAGLIVIGICMVCIFGNRHTLHTKGASVQEACEDEEGKEDGGATSAETSLFAWVNRLKRYQTYPLESHLQEKDAYFDYDNTKLAWWFKRDKNHGPSGCDDTVELSEFEACFFVTQTYIRDNLAIVKRMKKEGHQVGNHTIYHICMPDKSYEEIVQEVTGCAEYMKEATGYEMDPYLRPPSGEYSARTLAITRDLGYKTVFWSMAYLDYDVNNQPGVDFCD